MNLVNARKPVLARVSPFQSKYTNLNSKVSENYNPTIAFSGDAWGGLRDAPHGVFSRAVERVRASLFFQIFDFLLNSIERHGFSLCKSRTCCVNCI